MGISALTGLGGEKTSHVEFIKQFECDYANGLCLIHATVTLAHSRSCLQRMFMAAELFQSMKAPSFVFLTHTLES